MPTPSELLTQITTAPPFEAWRAIAEYVWAHCSAPVTTTPAEAEIVRRDKDLNELDNALSGSAWELWQHFEVCVPKASESLVQFWNSTSDGRAIFILDGLSLRESPWLLAEAQRRGYKLREAGCRSCELPADTTPFAKSLGFSQRSALDNNGAGFAHKLPGATTASCDLNWLDCVKLIGSQTDFVFWHHWPDARLHSLAGPGASLHKIAKETHYALTSDDFWALVERLSTGRRLVITSDHGYAACGHFHDITDKDQSAYLKATYKSGRSASVSGAESPWIPPIDIRIGSHQYVLGRRKWKSAAGYPTLQHGGLSLLEVFVPYIEIARN